MNTSKTVLVLGAMALVTLFSAQTAQAGQCRDPWVTQAIQQVKGSPNGSGETGDCNIRNFNNGHWNSYPELVGYVQRYFGGRSALAPSAVNAGQGLANNSNLLRNGNGIVAAGGGNIVAAGGGNIVAAGGGNIVAAGGGNLANRRNG